MTGSSAARSNCRRGVAVLVVLLMVSVAMAVAYVSMRSQSTALLVQRNTGLRGAARQAAMTGLAAAVKSMQSAGWAGVDTTLARSLGPGQRFEATFTTGDASLLPADADYDEYPYRVTLLVTGYAADPTRAGSQASHTIRAVARLVPRKLADEPTGWTDITDHAFCQWDAGDSSLTVPFRVEGPVRIRAELDLSESQLKWSADARRWYFEGLDWLRRNGRPDWRPFTGPVHLDYSEQDSDTFALLRTTLGTTTEDRSSASWFRWSSPFSSRTYRLYPGGKVYSVATLPSNLSGANLEPDPRTNPLGIFLQNGQLDFPANTTIRGTVLAVGSSNADVDFYGANVHLLPVDLPPLLHPDAPEGVPVRLATLVSVDDILFHRGSQASIEGLVMAADDFTVDNARQSETVISIRGKMAAKDIHIARRDEWDRSSSWWRLVESFWAPTDETALFPIWLQVLGMDPEPRMTIRPDEQEIRYHWQKGNDPIYVPHPDDEGLRWELLSWVDNPRT